MKSKIAIRKFNLNFSFLYFDISHCAMQFNPLDNQRSESKQWTVVILLAYKLVIQQQQCSANQLVSQCGSMRDPLVLTKSVWFKNQTLVTMEKGKVFWPTGCGICFGLLSQSIKLEKQTKTYAALCKVWVRKNRTHSKIGHQ